MIKNAIILITGIIVGAVGVFLYTASLLGELVAQAELTGMMSEIGTVSIYLRNSHKEESDCFLVRELAQKIRNGDAVLKWFKSKTYLLSGLSQLVIESFENLVQQSKGGEISSLMDRCKGA